MSAIEKIEKISKIGRKIHDPIQRIEPADQTVMKERFEALMREDTRKVSDTTQLAQDPNRPASPMAEARKLGGQTNLSKDVTPAEIVNRTDSAVKRIETVKDKLVENNVNLRPSVQGLLRKKLEHIDENINTALKKAGATESSGKAGQEQEMVDGVLNPVHRFLGMLTHGQSQLENLSSLVTGMGNKENVSPAALLGIQIKVARVQHEIELFTSLLNKALESTKTIMNVQV
ncbi:Uncharacterized protein SCG7086_AN_00110 [Chlamydiales bacterium SCGC AG-110-P3]|nr:Uncharacterized protein SCG7086_AN_00110 [Chlamydiales bacterium SCGC AG-110-P3]